MSLCRGTLPDHCCLIVGCWLGVSPLNSSSTVVLDGCASSTLSLIVLQSQPRVLPPCTVCMCWADPMFPGTCFVSLALVGSLLRGIVALLSNLDSCLFACMRGAPHNVGVAPALTACRADKGTFPCRPSHASASLASLSCCTMPALAHCRVHCACPSTLCFAACYRHGCTVLLKTQAV